jgi:hypothetical protein
VFDAAADVLSSYFVYAPIYLGGVRLAMRDRGGAAELVTASTLAAVSDVRVYDPLSQQVLDAFFEYGVGYQRGLTLGGE